MRLRRTPSSQGNGRSGLRRVEARSISEDKVVVARSEIAGGVLNVVELSELKKIALVSSGEEMRAYDMQCPHLGGDLSEGRFVDGEVLCPWHGYRFSTTDGRFVGNPNVDSTRLARGRSASFDPDRDPGCRLRAYEARSVGDEVHIQLARAPQQAS